MIDNSELETETFTNSQGWTVVRVTHVPTGEIAERQRSKQLVSSVQAQSECIAELRGRLAARTGAVVVPFTGNHAEVAPEQAVAISRAEFDALLVRVAAIEAALREGSNLPTN